MIRKIRESEAFKNAAQKSRPAIATLRRIVTPQRWRWAVLFLGVMMITNWRYNGWGNPDLIAGVVKKDMTSQVKFSRGVNQDWQFFYFLRHLGLFPLAPPGQFFRHDFTIGLDVTTITKDTDDEAERILRVDPEKLRMDEGLTWRSGGYGRTFLYYPDAWLHGGVPRPVLRTANEIGFALALLALFIAFWSVKRTALGAILVVFLGSDPVQVFSIYGEENVFSWNITTMIGLLALHVPLMFSSAGVSDAGVRLKRLWMLPVLAAVFLGVILTVRTEPVAYVASALLVYATLSNVTWRFRSAFALLFLATFALTNLGTGAYFNAKIAKTRAVVTSLGGTPFTAERPIHHELWHPIWCGLGDFDTKYGHIVDDLAAYKAALPIMEQRAGHKLPLNPNTWEQASMPLDPKGKYHGVFFEYPGYHDVIRSIVLQQIRNDPWWYIDILKQRFWRILTETTPLSVSWDGKSYETKSEMFGPFTLALLAFLFLARKNAYAILILFGLPLSFTAFLIYSGGGSCNYSVFHIFAAAVTCLIFYEGARAWLTASRAAWFGNREAHEALPSESLPTETKSTESLESTPEEPPAPSEATPAAAPPEGIPEPHEDQSATKAPENKLISDPPNEEQRS